MHPMLPVCLGHYDGHMIILHQTMATLYFQDSFETANIPTLIHTSIKSRYKDKMGHMHPGR
jgi:hypothetical protein